MKSTALATVEPANSVEPVKSVEQLLDDLALDLTALGNGWDNFSDFIDLR